MNKPVPYEIHVTVQTDNVQGFIETCKEIGVKPIVLDLQKSDGSIGIQDVMTSSKVTGVDSDALRSLFQVKNELIKKGFTVVREKVETAPWHPEAIVYDRNKAKDRYFETHIPISITPDGIEELGKVAKTNGCHMSRNPFKKIKGGRVVQMLTFRKKISAHVFEAMVGLITDDLTEAGYVIIGKVQTEFALFDSKVNHDAAWLNS